jgi:hypothetical protein
MVTVSFFLRRGAWLAAGVLLVSTFLVEQSVLMFACFLLVTLCAVGYTWFDNEQFGEPLSRFAFFHPETGRSVYEDARTHHDVQQTYYHKDTPRELVRLLDDLRQKGTRVGIHYGDPVTGLEERSVEGYVNCSSGAVQIPLLSQHGQQGGAPLIDQCIVQVVDLKHGYVLYQHPKYHAVKSRGASPAVAGAYAMC